MKTPARGSLRLRLWVAAALAVIAGLALSGYFLTYLFERHVIRRVDGELKVYLSQLASSLALDEAGEPGLERTLADPRFDKPFSGLYWQIDEANKPQLQSRSLWDQTLEVPKANKRPGEPRRHVVRGPDRGLVIVMARSVFLKDTDNERRFRLTVAIDRREITQARRAFAGDLMIALGVLAAILLGASWLQISLGLSPLGQLRDRLNDIRTGKHARMKGAFPSEVQPLVGELNALLEAQAQSVENARAQAGDLAHGLKTPLAILQTEARALRKKGDADTAGEIDVQIGIMTRHVERQLARARLRGSAPGAGLKVKPALDALIATVSRLPRGDELEWRTDFSGDLTLRIDVQDFDEIMGNLLDNARKWARSTVRISARQSGDGALVIVEDDGPGVPEGMLPTLPERGRKLDESKQGTGLGLAIVFEILDAYETRLKLTNRKSGGLRAEYFLSGM